MIIAAAAVIVISIGFDIFIRSPPGSFFILYHRIGQITNTYIKYSNMLDSYIDSWYNQYRMEVG